MRCALSPGVVAALVALAAACAWSWPFAITGGALPARNFDAFCVQWVAAAATRLDLALTDPLSEWPLGNSLAHADSFVYLAIARVLTPLVGVDGVVGGLAVLGPAVSAWAAERVARRDLGVPAPWSLLAGLVYAFNGLTATMFLEGHVYLLLVPWLPLLVGALHRLDARPDLRIGAEAAGWWSLCLLTSAYVGVGATLVVVVYALGAGRRILAPGFLALGAGCAVVGGLYAVAFAIAPEGWTGPALGATQAGSEMVHGSARLGTLLGFSPAVDQDGHSFWPSLPAAALALVAFARATPGPRLDRRVVALFVLALGLAFGPQLDAWQPDDLGLPWLLAPLGDTAFAARFRFPARLLLPASLALGVLAATVLPRLAASAPCQARLFGVLLAAECVLGAGLPWRTRAFDATLPAAYAATPPGWAVVDLLPMFSGAGEVDLAFTFDRLSCRWQALHGRPTLAQCVSTRPYAGLASAVSGGLLTRLTEGAPFVEDLRAVGIGAVVMRPDLYTPGDRARVREGLTAALGPVAARSVNGGDPLEVWTVPGATGEPPSREERVAALARWTGASP